MVGIACCFSPGYAYHFRRITRTRLNDLFLNSYLNQIHFFFSVELINFTLKRMPVQSLLNNYNNKVFLNMDVSCLEKQRLVYAIHFTTK